MWVFGAHPFFSFNWPKTMKQWVFYWPSLLLGQIKVAELTEKGTRGFWRCVWGQTALSFHFVLFFLFHEAFCLPHVDNHLTVCALLLLQNLELFLLHVLGKTTKDERGISEKCVYEMLRVHPSMFTTATKTHILPFNLRMFLPLLDFKIVVYLLLDYKIFTVNRTHVGFKSCT